MSEIAIPWQPVSNITHGFGSIAATLEPGNPRTLRVVMHGERSLELVFSNVIAFRFEDECPGVDPLPKPLPKLKDRTTYPLLTINDSIWCGQLAGHGNLVHYALISSDDLLQVAAGRAVQAHWVNDHAA